MTTGPSAGDAPGIDAWVQEVGEEAVVFAVEAARQEIADGRAFELSKGGDVETFAGRARRRPA